MTEALPLSPSAIAEWAPFAKAAGFFLATFVLEDVAAVGAGLLLATGGISWPAAFVAPIHMPRANVGLPNAARPF
jgi:hypothetical protein